MKCIKDKGEDVCVSYPNGLFFTLPDEPVAPVNDIDKDIPDDDDEESDEGSDDED